MKPHFYSQHFLAFPGVSRVICTVNGLQSTDFSQLTDPIPPEFYPIPRTRRRYSFLVVIEEPFPDTVPYPAVCTQVRGLFLVFRYAWKVECALSASENQDLE